MKCNDAKVLSNVALTPTIYEMKLEVDTSEISAPGQFVEVSCPSLFLRRPISICDWDESSITLVYRVVGSGTKIMSSLEEGDIVSVLMPCGNGYDVNAITPEVLIGGGVGVPPLYGLAKQLKQAGKPVDVVLGYASKEESFLIEEFKQVAKNVIICSDDGSIGVKGTVMQGVAQLGYELESYCACGPKVMFKSLHQSYPNATAYLSLEERMGCGFGGCMGCSIKTIDGYKRVCKEGPVFNSKELLWED